MVAWSKWLTMKQTEWPLFSEPTIETEINIDKLELKKSINVNTAVEKRQIENNLVSRYSSFSKLTLCDNATNFKGARNILNEWNEICKSNTIQLFCAEEGIEWNFSPPTSSHFDGLWEANIKSTKHILLRVAKSAIMNFEELTTLVTQIEAVLNSRPLSPLSSDPNDLNPLTPGHFLTNCAISSFPEPYTASDSLSYHSGWKLLQSLRNKIWNSRSTEYLTHFQTRAK
ncbi:integrase catalytic domain-containing protein [Trichonephila clavipes]|nr:integrase catalytic domain-containing protein [Trichonephila clavipes]